MNDKGPHALRLRYVFLSLLCAVLVPIVIFEGFLMFMAVPSDSMYPTLQTGTLLVGVRHPKQISRGDILVFQPPGGVKLIKRLIGMPGDTVSIDRGGKVSVNGTALDEPYVQNQRSGQPQAFSVPDGCLLFLGDNRAHSFDARYWENPYVPLDRVLAKANLKIFPRIEGLER